MKLMVILGSVRAGRRGEKIAHWATEQIKQDGRFNEVELVDVKELDLPLYNEVESPMMLASQGKEYAEPKGRAWADKVAGADAFVLVNAEYNHGYSASLKNALDWVGNEWFGKPVGFVSYGWSGGIRSTEQLRQVVAELGLVQTRFAVPIRIGNDLDENGNPNQESSQKSLSQMLDQIIALKK